jgi:DNA repair exonuclease SbcCD nuclease subunit
MITDVHFGDVLPGYLDAQIDCLKNIYDSDTFDHVLILGDVFIKRSPKPKVLLKTQEFLNYISKKNEVTIIKGNHDAETKADDGVTALSLFKTDKVRVYEHIGADNEMGWFFIPHYEDESIIREALESCPRHHLVFGHFGYDTYISHSGNYGGIITLRDFRNRSFLGHLHHNITKDGVTVLGTQYTTSYRENEKVNWYGILEGEPYNWTYTQKKVEGFGGPRHLTYAIEDIYPNLEKINDPSYFTLLRVFIDSLSGDNTVNLQEDLARHCKVEQIDIQYNPVFMDEEISNFTPSGDVFSITDDMIDNYIEQTTTTLSKQDLLEGLKILKDAD